MTLSGSDSKLAASPSVAPAKLDPERAEALAASMRPSWEPDPPAEAMPLPAAPSGVGPDSATLFEAAPAGALAGMAPNQTIPLGAMSSSTALSLVHAQSSRDLTPEKPRSLRPSAPEYTPRTPSAAPPSVQPHVPALVAEAAPMPDAPVTERMSSAPMGITAARDPFASSASAASSGSSAPAARAGGVRRPLPSAGATDEFKALVRKPSKGVVYGLAGVAILGTVFVLARAGASGDASPPQTTSAAPTTTALTAAPKGRAAEEIPPPPPARLPEEPAAFATAAPIAEPIKVTPVAPVATSAPAPAAQAPAAPAKAAAPVRTATPAKSPKPTAAPAAPAPQPKSAPKGGTGGIVRDTPF